jgi:hypothetical protein
MSTGTLQIKAMSGHSGSIPGVGAQRAEEVCKYIDVTTCIGCNPAWYRRATGHDPRADREAEARRQVVRRDDDDRQQSR